MKKIINGKKYDTNTAKEVAFREWSYVGEINYCLESLYRKRTGEFFLYGTGGPLSKYAVGLNNGGSQAGSLIMPMTEQQAREWAELNIDGDTYEEIFGEVEE